MWRYFKIREDERGLLYRDGVFRRILRPGRNWVFDPLLRARVRRVSVREPWLESEDLDVIVRSGQLAGLAEVIDLADRERALVWIDGRFAAVVGPGLYALWTVFCRVRVDRVATDPVLFEHPQLSPILPKAGVQLESVQVAYGHAGLLFLNGQLVRRLEPGRYAVWRGLGNVTLRHVDLRERVLEVSGQEIMTADKVTLRLNALVTFRVTDPVVAASVSENYDQALYREAQLALRSVVGTLELDALLSEKDAVAQDLERLVREHGTKLGLEVFALGIRDVILPGEMKVLLNQVTEARKAAEANLISRREETAAMRSQLNTARMLESNPTLMRLRELEVLEKVAERTNLTVMLGEGGLTERVVKLL